MTGLSGRVKNRIYYIKYINTHYFDILRLIYLEILGILGEASADFYISQS